MTTPHLFRPRGRAGFTLTELMITVGIAVVISAMAYPRLSAWVRSLSQRSATSQLVADLTMTRTQAVRVGRAASLTLENATTYRVAYASPVTTGDTLVKRVKIEGAGRGTTLAQVSRTYPATITFDSRGMRRSSLSTFLVVRSDRTDTVSISWVGRVYRGQEQ
ncbi:GspH/FimT family pseudopilin [Longimicrobium terrae]|nr:GspH/FimT family pseudopilin [Longimicrobium terrae]MBB4639218.1 type IV fimbrial biogenesis protein FimT [Longimicrobium terrae]